jgi:hypothetical protein
MLYLISTTQVICSIAASFKFGVWIPEHVGVEKYHTLDVFVTCALCWFHKWILSTDCIQNKAGNTVSMCLGGHCALKCHILFMLGSFTLYLSVGWMEGKPNAFPSGILKQRPEFSRVQYLISKILPLLYQLGIVFNPLNTELNPICHLLALLGAHHILHVSRIRVKLLSIDWVMGSD